MSTSELFLFTRGSETWAYTSGDESVEYNGQLYVPTVMKRSSFEVRNELNRSKLEVNISRTAELPQNLLSDFTEKLLILTLFVKDSFGVYGVAWKGRLVGKTPNVAWLDLNFESVFTSLRRPGLRARFQKGCRHVVYQRGCNLNKDDWVENFEDDGSVEISVSGVTVTVPGANAFADSYFIGGMIEEPGGLYGFIVNKVGNVLTLQRPLDNLTRARNSSGYGINYGEYYGGIFVNLYPGCDLSRGTCLNRFNNLNNYGGFPFIPFKNPMGGTSIL